MTTTNRLRPQGPTDSVQIEHVTVPRSFEEKQGDAASTVKEQLTSGLTGKLTNPPKQEQSR